MTNNDDRRHETDEKRKDAEENQLDQRQDRSEITFVEDGDVFVTGNCAHGHRTRRTDFDVDRRVSVGCEPVQVEKKEYGSKTHFDQTDAPKGRRIGRTRRRRTLTVASSRVDLRRHRSNAIEIDRRQRVEREMRQKID